MLPRVSRQAGLGVFIVNNRTGSSSTIYIKALLKNSSSVLMAEAAALALGAQVLCTLGIQQPFFLSDNQQLVSFFNGKDHINPPQWEIKPFTQIFIINTSRNNARTFKIDRKLNITSHILGTQAFNSSNSNSHELVTTCTNPFHVNSCLSLTAINSVLGDSFTLIAASCC